MIKLSNIFKKISKNYELTVAFLILLTYPIVNLISVFYLNKYWILHSDFRLFYDVGKEVFTDPSDIYKKYYGWSYYYLPSFAIAMGLTFSLLPLLISSVLFKLVQYMFACLSLHEINEILKIHDVNGTFVRFLVLFACSNGWIVYNIFWGDQVKFFVSFVFLYSFKELMLLEKAEKPLKTTKFFFLTFAFVFALGISPYLFYFYLIVFFFKLIDLKEFFVRFFLLIASFLVQNFLFVLYPSMIFKFLDGFFLYSNNISKESVILSILCNVLILTLSVVLTFKRLPLIQKTGLLSVIIITLNYNSFSSQFTYVITFPFVFLSLSVYFVEKNNLMEFIKANEICGVAFVILFVRYAIPDFRFFLRNFNFKLDALFEILLFSLIVSFDCFFFYMMKFQDCLEGKNKCCTRRE